ncbi:Gfo/Idh/MocA family oxidoreductase [Streptomyces sp. NPDC054933]
MRVVVCGTGFGRTYVTALRSMPGHELVGILARGSEFSRRYARDQGVPCYTSVAQLPQDVDLACVVVGSSVSGGKGSELARSLLATGIPVLQEHPVLPEELAVTVRTAAAHQVWYQLNPFYRYLAPVRTFLAAADRLRQVQRPLFVDAAAPIQLLYPLVDLLGRALGGFRPWKLATLPHGGGPYRLVQGVLGGVPLTLRVQNQLHPGDADNHALMWHRITIGTEGGVLSLADSHGPVLWSTRLHAPRDTDHRLRRTGPGTEQLDLPSTTVLPGSRPPDTLREIFERLWPSGIAAAVEEFGKNAASGTSVLDNARHDLTASRVWEEITDRLGRPELIHPAAPRPLDLTALMP